MTALAGVVLAGAAALGLYAYAGYPAALWLLARRRRASVPRHPPFRPGVSVSIPVHNGARTIGAVLDAVLATSYPRDRLQVLVISDASTDGTDAIVRGYADRGVELLRLPERGGKTAAENAGRARLRGEVIVNTDASVRVHPDAIERLVDALADPGVGVASGRDVSVAALEGGGAAGESAYVGYEMGVRDLETRAGGIVGASGCLYAIRRGLHLADVAPELSRDFAAALIARRSGLRAVSVPAAVCFVPRNASLAQEYRRKVRTMARGLRTLWAMRDLLDPRRHGRFAWMLASHKLCRWLVPWAALVGGIAAVTLLAGVLGAVSVGWAAAAAGGAALAVAAAPRGRAARFAAIPMYAAASLAAGLHAWVTAVSPGSTAVWEPTRRGLERAAAQRHDGQRPQHDAKILEG